MNQDHVVSDGQSYHSECWCSLGFKVLCCCKQKEEEKLRLAKILFISKQEARISDKMLSKDKSMRSQCVGECNCEVV